ncbi:7183_t:CDS:2, partial [Dentiscutata erythropus]
ASGLAKVVDWSIALVTDGPTKLRAAENSAKEKKLKIWCDYITKSKAGGDDHEFEGTVTRIISGDTLCVKVNRTGVEKKLQLSSIRQPKPKDPKLPGYNFEAKEFLRKELIGKTVRVTIDYQKPAVEGYEARECATIKLGDFNPAEKLLENGLANIIRHKKDDDDRSSCYDELLVAEKKAQTYAKGVHSTKEPPLHRFNDASEIQNYKMTFIIGGIRVPRLGKSSTEKPEPFAAEALEFANRKLLQRDVEIEVENVDKTGGFIGTLWINKTENYAASLLREGFAKTH